MNEQIQCDWVCTEHEMPPQDGYYEVTNNPEYEIDWFKTHGTKSAMLQQLWYDGYGFIQDGIYRAVRYWRPCLESKKRYGKVS